MERTREVELTALCRPTFTPLHLSIALSLLLPITGCQTPPHAAPVSTTTVINVFEQFLLEEPGDNWTVRTPQLWRVAQEGNRRFLQMAIPPERPALPGVRRPREYALFSPYQFRSFSMSVRVRVDRDPSVARRDAVVILGWQDDTHCYYAHLSGSTDEWHNALVRVDGQTRISLIPPAQRPAPTMTDLAWHKVDVLRDADTGTISVYVDAYDEAAQPVFRVVDRTYEWGYIGLGSFDDHASFAQIKIEGQARPAARPQITTRPAS